MIEGSSRKLSRSAARWQWLRSRMLWPVRSWLSNRWNWREARRAREMTAGWVRCPAHPLLGPPGSSCENCGQRRPGGSD